MVVLREEVGAVMIGACQGSAKCAARMWTKKYAENARQRQQNVKTQARNCKMC
jgi:hypothetical protein